ncbi:hypothetical protein SprV_0501807600 [Sparganum proliferum]
MVTKAICDAGGWMDHHLAICKMRLRLQPHRRPLAKRPSGDLIIVLLNLPTHRLHFSRQLAQNLQDPAVPDVNATVEARWYQLRDAVHSAAHVVHTSTDLTKQRSHEKPARQKNRLQGACLDRPTDAMSPASIATITRHSGRLKPRKAEEIQDYAERNEAKKFFAAIRAVYDPPTERTMLLLSSDRSTLLTGKSVILKR